ncbi:HNH endonuclease [Nocardioides sp. GY 10127]|uniref:HNH endonuclease n=1 Tax=Nocardioides sp. GY 10127 TaxID=2569762 RepID=UPI0010A8DD88|nr:HNH endonuclease [Nocardioides sp. GY 10127]TIC78806.1 HNH endonuclease [Nocardioides sp. GY 10127]
MTLPYSRRTRPARRRDTGPTTETRILVRERSAGRCEGCGRALHAAGTWTADHSFHHRRPRGMGGTTDPAANTPANLLLLCGTGTTGCHGWVESNRGKATALGWLVPRGTDPADVPVYDIHATRDIHDHVWLTTDGYYTPTPPTGGHR